MLGLGLGPDISVGPRKNRKLQCPEQFNRQHRNFMGGRYEDREGPPRSCNYVIEDGAKHKIFETEDGAKR